jgi:hypothetical protein
MFEEESSCFKASDQADKNALDPEYVASNYSQRISPLKKGGKGMVQESEYIQQSFPH